MGGTAVEQHEPDAQERREDECGNINIDEFQVDVAFPEVFLDISNNMSHCCPFLSFSNT